MMQAKYLIKSELGSLVPHGDVPSGQPGGAFVGQVDIHTIASEDNIARQRRTYIYLTAQITGPASAIDGATAAGSANAPGGPSASQAPVIPLLSADEIEVQAALCRFLTKRSDIAKKTVAATRQGAMLDLYGGLGSTLTASGGLNTTSQTGTLMIRAALTERIDRVANYVEARIKDPATPPKEAALLTARFGDALAIWDKLQQDQKARALAMQSYTTAIRSELEQQDQQNLATRALDLFKSAPLPVLPSATAKAAKGGKTQATGKTAPKKKSGASAAPGKTKNRK